jgi:hypothetical protein
MKMRDIYFRGKSAFYPHNFIYGDLVSNKHNDLFINNIPYTAAIRVIKETVGQYIGARDKKGNMIFEGDIIRDPEGDIGYIIYSLRYLDYRIAYFSTSNKDYALRVSDWGYNCTDLVVEVIDNIYDSPDYLTKEYNNG